MCWPGCARGRWRTSAYLLRVVYTCGAHALRERMRPTLSLDVEAGDGVEAQVDRASAPVSAEEQMLREAEVAQVRRIIERVDGR